MSSSWYKFRYIDIKGNRKVERIKAKSLRLAKQYITSKNYNLISIRKVYQFEKYILQFKKTKLYKTLFQPKLTRNEVYWLTKKNFMDF